MILREPSDKYLDQYVTDDGKMIFLFLWPLILVLTVQYTVWFWSVVLVDFVPATWLAVGTVGQSLAWREACMYGLVKPLIAVAVITGCSLFRKLG
jgi:hypothetical protein